jgi:predicted lysophospholipase L1 biosynthesis ABC-type transport system permease subunit
MQPSFFVLFPEGVLEPAPKTYAAALRAATPADAARAQVAVARELPGISAIDLALILQTFDGIFAKVAFVITFMAGFTVVTGIVVLVGAILTGRFQRIRETVLLRTLGATRRQLTQIQLVGNTPCSVCSRPSRVEHSRSWAMRSSQNMFSRLTSCCPCPRCSPRWRRRWRSR